MSEALSLAYQAIDEQNSHESAHTRRKLVAGTAAGIGGIAAMAALPGFAEAQSRGDYAPQKLLNIAATAEVLATVVNTIGHERRGQLGLDPVTARNVQAAAREELIHYNVLVSLGAKPLSRRVSIPDRVFANRENFLNFLVAGDQLFVNAYLIATTAFGRLGQGRLARAGAEFMGAEAVHRALALQSLGRLGNDRAFMRYRFSDIDDIVQAIVSAGVRFGTATPQGTTNYNFVEVRRRTPDDPDVNTRTPR
jgi:hypothetical protein